MNTTPPTAKPLGVSDMIQDRRYRAMANEMARASQPVEPVPLGLDWLDQVVAFEEGERDRAALAMAQQIDRQIALEEDDSTILGDLGRAAARGVGNMLTAVPAFGRQVAESARNFVGAGIDVGAEVERRMYLERAAQLKGYPNIAAFRAMDPLGLAQAERDFPLDRAANPTMLQQVQQGMNATAAYADQNPIAQRVYNTADFINRAAAPSPTSQNRAWYNPVAVAETAVENAPQMAAQIAGTVATRGMGPAWARFGASSLPFETGSARAEMAQQLAAQGLTPEQINERLGNVPMYVGLANAALEGVSGRLIGEGAGRGMMTRAALGALGEGTTEVPQEFVNAAAEAAVGSNPDALNPDQLIPRLGRAGLAGAALGGVTAATPGVANSLTEPPYGQTDPRDSAAQERAVPARLPESGAVQSVGGGVGEVVGQEGAPAQPIPGNVDPQGLRNGRGQDASLPENGAESVSAAVSAAADEYVKEGVDREEAQTLAVETVAAQMELPVETVEGMLTSTPDQAPAIVQNPETYNETVPTEPSTPPEQAVTTPAEVTQATTPTTPETAAPSLIDRLNAIEQAAMNRRRQRSAVLPRNPNMPNARPGSTNIPAELLDVIVVAAARAAKAGITAAQAIRQEVVKAARELGVLAIPTDVNRASYEARRIVSRSYKAETFDPGEFERQVARLQQPPTPDRKQAANQSAGVTKAQPPTVSERTALKEAIRQRAAGSREGFIAGKRQAQAAADAELRATVAEIKAENKQTTETQERLRNILVQTVNTSLPLAERGRFITAIRDTTTVDGLFEQAGRVLAHSIASRGRRELARLKGLAAADRLKALDQDRRTEARNLISRAEAFKAAFALRGLNAKDAAVLESDLNTLRDTVNELAALHADQKADNTAFAADQVRTRREHVDALIANVNKVKKAKVPLGQSAGTDYASFVRFGDADNIANALEGKDGVIHGLLVKAIREADDKRLGLTRDLMDRLDGIARNAGYSNMADAMAKTAAALGESNAERISVRLGGQERSMLAGEVMAIVAHAGDPTTRELVLGGMPVVTAEMRERSQRGFTISAGELLALRYALSPEQLKAVDQAKALIESVRGELFEAVRKIKGTAPDAIDGYYPRRRAMEQGQPKEPPSGWAGTRTRYLENAGILQAREGGTKTPLALGNLFADVEAYIDSAAKVIHLAQPIREAHGVLYDPDVREAISAKHGPQAVRRIEEFLSAFSQSQPPVVTTMGRLAQTLNSNIATARLSLNLRTWIAQLGGITRLWAVMGADLTAADVAAAAKVTTEDLVQSSGYLWQRYRGDAAKRLSAVVAPDAEADATFVQALRSVGRSVAKLDAKGAAAAYRKLLSSIKILDFFDSLNARVAFAAYLRKAKAQNPGWNDAKAKEWAGARTAEVIRATQNASTVLDMSSVAIRSRGTGSSIFGLFQSDPLRTWNRIVKATRTGNGTRMAIAEALNMVWVALTRRVILTGTGVGAAYLAGNDDEAERLLRIAKDKFLGDMLDQAIGTAVPIWGGFAREAVTQFAGGKSDPERLANFPVPSTLSALWDGTVKATAAVQKGMTEQDQEKAAEAMARAAENGARGGNAVLSLLGVPAVPLFQDVINGVKAATAQADRKTYTDEAAAALKSGDSDTAADRLAVLFKQAKPAERTALRRSLISSMEDRHPLGKLTEAERTRQLRQLPDGERAEWFRWKNQAAAVVNRAQQRALSAKATP